MSELVSKTNWYVFIDTGGVIWVYVVGLFLGASINTTIKLFVRTVRGMIYFTSCIFEVLIERKVSETCYFGGFNWYIVLSMAAIADFLSRSVSKMWVGASTSSIIWSGTLIKLNLYPSSSCSQQKIMGIVP